MNAAATPTLKETQIGPALRQQPGPRTRRGDSMPAASYPPTVERKTCTRCKSEKWAEEFPRSKRSKDGLDSWCRRCRADNERERRARNPEAERAKDRRRYQHDGAARRRRARRKNPYGHKLTKLKQEYGAEAMPQIELLLHDPCSYCGERKPDVGIDHIVPRSAGGSNHWSNLTACCNQCNGRKHAKPMLIALAERNGYRREVVGWAYS